jgi:hypothetical protein
LSRIESARQRANAVKRALAVLAAAGLVTAGLLARATNPGHAARANRATDSSSSSSTGTGSEGQSSSDDFSIAPSTSQPQVQTNVS